MKAIKAWMNSVNAFGFGIYAKCWSFWSHARDNSVIIQRNAMFYLLGFFAVLTPITNSSEHVIAAGFMSAGTIADVLLAIVVIIIFLGILVAAAKNQGDGKQGLVQQLFAGGTLIVAVVSILVLGTIYWFSREKVQEWAYAIDQFLSD